MKFFKIKPDYNFHDAACGCTALTPYKCGSPPGTPAGSPLIKMPELHGITRCALVRPCNVKTKSKYGDVDVESGNSGELE